MPDPGLTEAVRSLVSSMRAQIGASAGLHPFGGPSDAGSPSDLPPSWLDEQKDVLKGHTDNLRKATEDHTKGIRRENEDFLAKSAGLGLKVAPFLDAIHSLVKFGISRPAELMGGSTGQAMRAGLERSTAAGVMATDTIAAILALSGVGLPVAGLVAGAGRAGVGTALGDMFLGSAATKQGFRQNYVQNFESKIYEDERAGMFAARVGRLQAQAGAWGGSPGMVQDTVRGLRAELNEDPEAMTAAFAQAFSAGGNRGIKNIDWQSVSDLVKKGFGEAGQIMVMQAVAGRYGYDKNALPGMADRTGLTMDQVLPMMQQSAMQFALFRAGTADIMNKMVGNTTMATMNPSLAMSTANRIGQGASSISDEPGLMLQFRAFRQANPGADYMQFQIARRTGITDPMWRKTVQAMAQRASSGGPEDLLLGGGLLNPAGGLGEIAGMAGFLGEMGGPAAKRAGARIPGAAEKYAQLYGTQGAIALDDSMKFVEKSVFQFGGEMRKFADHVSKAAQDIALNAVETSRAIRGIIKQEEAVFNRGTTTKEGLHYGKEPGKQIEVRGR